MNRAEKRDAIVAALREDPRRPDRAIARELGISHATVAEARKRLTGGQIETDQRPRGGQIETDHWPDWLQDPSKRTVDAVVGWLLRMWPDAPKRP
jgi:hypothetical protein